MATTMLVQFLRDYQGKATGPHFYRANQTVGLDEAVALVVIGEGAAVAAPDPVPDPAPDEMQAGGKRSRRK